MKKHLLPVIIAVLYLLCSNSIGAQGVDSSKLNKMENRVEKRERKDEKLDRKSHKNQKKLNRQERKLRKEQKKLRKQQNIKEQTEGTGNQSAFHFKMQDCFYSLTSSWAFEKKRCCAMPQHHVKRMIV